MHLKLIEPLRELFKDEVRLIGKDLGIPDVILQRHPFPGPGLGVRILGDVTPEKVELLQKADAIFIEELKNFGSIRRGLAGVCRAAADPVGRRDGRFSHVRKNRRAACRYEHRRNDGRLGASSARFARSRFVADHQRGPRRQPRRL